MIRLLINNLFRSSPSDAEGKPYKHSTLQKAGRGVALLILVLTLLLVALLGGDYAHRYFRYYLPRSQVVVAAEFDPQICTTPGYPLHLSIRNNSTRTVLSVQVQLSARVPGRINNYADYSGLSSDHIVYPQTQSATCERAMLNSVFERPLHTRDPGIRADRLLWSVADFRVTFE